MSPSDAHAVAGHGHAEPSNPHLKDHFASMAAQDSAVRLGMWLFLATEVLLFAGIFCGYAIYRYLFPHDFKLASHILDVTMGGGNTIVLLVSSFTVALGVYYARAGENRKAAAFLAVTILCAMGFLVIKFFEYKHKFHIGALPGRHYFLTAASSGLPAAQVPSMPGGVLYFTIYFLATGLHAFHVMVGMGILTWLMVRCLKNEFATDYFIPVELGGIYWHLVDLIWIFLFPLLYLI